MDGGPMNCNRDENQFIGSPVPSAEESRAELRRILDSSSFEASARNRRFLEYVVETSLAGCAARIKAYNIATDVFGRDGAFDPQLDPIVRIEASRLRRALERFYLIDRTPAAVRIDIPKGSYAPTLPGSRRLRTWPCSRPSPRSP